MEPPLISHPEETEGPGETNVSEHVAQEWAANIMIAYLNGRKIPDAEVIMLKSGILTRDDVLAGKTLKDTITDPFAFALTLNDVLPPDMRR